MKIISNERVHTDVRTLVVEIPTDTVDDLLFLALKNIYEQKQGMDPSLENYPGNTSDEALEYMYANLEQKCAATKDEFEVGFEHFLSLMVEGLHLSIDPAEIQILWGEPTRINNVSEAINNVKNSLGIVSQRTLLNMHPNVENVDEEIEQLNREKEQSEATYPGFEEVEVNEERPTDESEH